MLRRIQGLSYHYCYHIGVERHFTPYAGASALGWYARKGELGDWQRSIDLGARAKYISRGGQEPTDFDPSCGALVQFESPAAGNRTRGSRRRRG